MMFFAILFWTGFVMLVIPTVMAKITEALA